MRRLRARKIDSANGEVHFILQESQASEHSERFKDYDVFEIKKVTRKEAAKPLLLLRED
jgi:hypothetical protein